MKITTTLTRLCYTIILIILYSALVNADINLTTSFYKWQNNNYDNNNLYNLTDFGSGNGFNSNSPMFGSFDATFNGAGFRSNTFNTGTWKQADFPLAMFTWINWTSAISTSNKVVLSYGRDNTWGCGSDGGFNVQVLASSTQLTLASGCGGSSSLNWTPVVGRKYFIGVLYAGNKTAYLILNNTMPLNYTFVPNGGGGVMKLNCSGVYNCFINVGGDTIGGSNISVSRFGSTRFYINQTISYSQSLELYNDFLGTQDDPISQNTPIISFVSPTPINNTILFIDNNNVTINTTTLNFGGIINISHYLYNTSGFLVRINNQTNEQNYSSIFLNVSAGTYYFNATVTNNTHSNFTQTRSLMIDNINIIIDLPNSNQPVQNSLNINWTVQQTGSTTINRTNITINTVSVTNINGNATNFTWNNIYNWNLTSGTQTLYFNFTTSLGNLIILNQTINITRNTLINVTAKSNTGVNITTFNGWIYQRETGLNLSYSTTNGTAFLDHLRGNLTIYIQAVNYSPNINLSLVGVNVTTKQYDQVFTLFPLNTLNITFYDQSTPTILASGLNITLELISVGFSNNYSTTNGNIYIPGLVSDTYTLRYTSPSHTVRFYGLTLSDSDYQLIRLYLINRTVYQNISVFIVNQVLNPIEGAVVKALKYNLATNTFILQEIRTTDINGRSILSLTFNDEFYSFMIEYPLGTLRKTTSPAYISSTSITIPLDISEDILQDFKNYQSITYSLTYNNNTNNFRFQYNDGSAIASQYCLYIYVMTNASQTLTNSTCTTGASGNIFQGVSSTPGKTYLAVATYFERSSSIEKFLISIYGETPTSNPLGIKYGLFLQLLLTLAFASFSILNMGISLILVPFSLIIGKLLGLNILGWNGLVTIQAVGFIVAIMVSMKR